MLLAHGPASRQIVPARRCGDPKYVVAGLQRVGKRVRRREGSRSGRGLSGLAWRAEHSAACLGANASHGLRIHGLVAFWLGRSGDGPARLLHVGALGGHGPPKRCGMELLVRWPRGEPGSPGRRWRDDHRAARRKTVRRKLSRACTSHSALEHCDGRAQLCNSRLDPLRLRCERQNAMMKSVKRYELVAAALRSNIVSGRLQPGLVLLEGPIAGLMKTSRAPVQAALRILEEEKLIRRFGGRGYLVGRAGTSVAPGRRDIGTLGLRIPNEIN